MSKKASSKDENQTKEDVKENTSEKEAEKKEAKEPTVEDQLKDAKDQLLRTAAEYANFRARSAKEKEQTYSNAKGDVITEILPVIDNLERAVNAEQSDYESLKKGVEMTLESLMATLEKLGVESYGENGDVFDPKLHNAVMHEDGQGLDETVINDVFQKGYKIKDRVIRPAMVKTAN
ncbi:MAG: nucleotide exchange factor GrpE [Eubacterium sp.]